MQIQDYFRRFEGKIQMLEQLKCSAEMWEIRIFCARSIISLLSVFDQFYQFLMHDLLVLFDSMLISGGGEKNLFI